MPMASVLLTAASALPQDVTTGGYGNARANANVSESILTPSNVKPGIFGKLFALPVDGQIYAQPLYRKNLAIPGNGSHNVVFVATMHNTVYAFDADSPGMPLWSVNLGPSVPTSNYASDTGDYTDIEPENGILSTPVIDPATDTLYAVAATFNGAHYAYTLHALDDTTGTERFGAPVAIAAQVPGAGDNSVNGSVAFDPSQHLQRPALLLSNGVVYVAFGSHGDAAPYHGWIMAYSAQNLQQQTALFNATPNGSGGAIWQSGRGLTADDAGNIYAVTSNGDTDFHTGFSDTVLRLDPAELSVQDWFAPFNFEDLDDGDDDLGAAGAIPIEGTTYLVTGGKQGVIYVLDSANLGHVGEGDGQIVQSFSSGSVGVFNLALWNRPDGPVLYIHAINSPVAAYKTTNGLFGETPAAQSASSFPVPYQGMTLSANGSLDGSGVLWLLAPTATPETPGVLHAYDADNLDEIWNSAMADADAVGGYVKFANPTVADGRVYVPTGSNRLVVYGVLPPVSSTNAPTVTAVMNAASYTEGPVSPGEIVVILGANLGPVDLVSGAFSETGELTTGLAGGQVTFNGIPAPLVYSSAAAIAAVVPYEVSGQDTVAIQVAFNGATSATQTVAVADCAPGVFSADASGSGPGSILNQDSSVNSPANPSQPGSVVVVYATGGGLSNPPAPTGSRTTAAAPLASNLGVTIGGQPAQVLYAGNAGGLVAGVLQINVTLPDGVTGASPVVVTEKGCASQATVTVSIR